MSDVTAPSGDFHAALAATWDALRSRDCYRQPQRGKIRIVWWPRCNIFPQRTDYMATARALLPRRTNPAAKEILAAVRHLDDCTLPYAPPFATIEAADAAMFDEGDKYSIDMETRRNILVDVLHTVPPAITPRQIKEVMRKRFESSGAPRALRMTAKAAGHSQAEFRSAGWTDAQLVEHGYAVAT